jgi:hypothetical protein
MNMQTMRTPGGTGREFDGLENPAMITSSHWKYAGDDFQ